MKTILMIIFALTLRVKAQGEPCTTHSNLRGICVQFQSCGSLIQLYQSSQSQQAANILVINQRRCGNRRIGRNPLLCCSDSVQQNSGSRPGQQTQPTQPPTTTTTTTPPPPPPTQAPLQSTVDCSSPDGVNGYCIHVKQCPSVLATYTQRKNDPEYVKYIRQSNANCKYAAQAICCPNGDSPTPAPTVATTEATAVVTPPPNAGTRAQLRLLTPSEGCGISKVPHNRVVGGVPAKQGGWPWMTLVGYKNSLGEISFKCGGSIITKRHVLTAAHCMRNDLFLVRVGEHDLSTDSETQHVDIAVKSKVPHPAYDKRDGHSDLAILALEDEINFTTLISPICLPINEPEKSNLFLKKMPFVAGWGRTQEGGKSANVLQELQLPTVPNEQCKADYDKIGKVGSEKQFDDSVLCAGYREGGKDSCQGDSGGPLMFPVQKEDYEFYYYQIGVVSYGIGCARAEVPGVYTRTSKFIDWISETISST